MSKEAAYKSRGHKYHGDNYGRAGRKDSKIMKAMKGVASFELLDSIAREDARRRSNTQKGIQ
jgi:hypothetical protein